MLKTVNKLLRTLDRDLDRNTNLAKYKLYPKIYSTLLRKLYHDRYKSIFLQFVFFTYK